jgi:hypothetical protein
MELPVLSDYYKKYKNDPQQCRAETLALGKRYGQELMNRLKLKGDDLATLAAVVNAFMAEIKAETNARVEDNKVIYYNRSFCPIMITAKSFNQPWLWLDENAAWPLMQGLSSAVNPNIRHYVAHARAEGDLVCQHVWELDK